MSIEYRTGDLLKQTDLDILMHGCNCQCTMGSGIAKGFRDKWPQVYEADKTSIKGDREKMGGWTAAKVTLDNGATAYVCNLYVQYDYGAGQRQVDYEALYAALERMRDHAKTKAQAGAWTRPFMVGMPYLMSADRAGGSWEVISSMLKVLFEDESLIKLVIVRLP